MRCMMGAEALDEVNVLRDGGVGCVCFGAGARRG
jgi:hypothetical protein